MASQMLARSKGLTDKVSRVRGWLLHHSRYGWVTGCVLTTLAGLLFCNAFFNQNLVYRSYDLPLVFRKPLQSSEVILVYMDEDSREALGLPWDQAWDRNLHAQLLERLTEGGARAVVFDVVFTEARHSGPTTTNTTPDTATRRLAAAMRSNGRVVIASHLRRAGQPGIALGFSLETPEDALAQAAAGVGVAETIEDMDTVVRRFWLRVPGLAGVEQYTLAREAARVASGGGNNGLEKLPNSGWLNYYGEPGRIESVSYNRALKELPPGYFRDKVVVVGVFYPMDVSGARIDTFRSPFSFGQSRFAGAEIHATVLLNLLRRDWLRRAPPLVEFLLIIAAGIGVGGLLPRLQPFRALALAVAIGVFITVLAFQLQLRGRIWFPWLIPVAVQIPIALVWAILWKTIQTSVESQFLEQSLTLFLSPGTVRSFLRKPELLHPGGERRIVSILGSDITNFSKISNRMDAEDLLGLLNQYYEQMIHCIHATDGTVVELIGDAIFAVWNAPQDQSDHQNRMLRTALALQSKLVELNNRPDLPPLFTRLGLHTGDACVGNVGLTTHIDYTAVGQSVNLAFRLESFNKHLGTSILASRDFLKGATVPITSRMVGHFRFKGFDGVFEVYEILGGPELAESTKPWRDTFTRGVHHFRRRAFNEAEIALRETLSLRQEDGPSKFLLEHIRVLKGVELRGDWAGEIDLDQK